VVYLRLTPEGERRLDGALLENEQYRRELSQAFGVLAETYRIATRARRPEGGGPAGVSR
jgi:hypothetical protein